MKQVISIAPDGSMHALKQCNALDLRAFGRADIRRATLIEWDADLQAWFIRWCDPRLGEGVWKHEDGRVITFQEYEEAVAHEVATIQTMQRAGKLAALGAILHCVQAEA